MYNYSTNHVSINAEVMEAITNFNSVARALATESVDHTTTKKALAEELEKYVKDGKVDEATETQKAIEAEDDRWTTRRKELEFDLYGGKLKDGTKVDGICSIVTDDLYKAYVAFVAENKGGEYRAEMKKFVIGLVNEEAIKDGAFNHFFIDIKTTMQSVKYNSNSQIAKGSAFITTVNKRMYKKMLLGAICDIVANNKTLKVKKVKTEK